VISQRTLRDVTIFTNVLPDDVRRYKKLNNAYTGDVLRPKRDVSQRKAKTQSSS